jgi:hypothetical protein
MAQPASSEASEIAGTLSLLKSTYLENRSWGAFEAGLSHKASIQKLLIDELRAARDLSNAPEDSEQYAYVQSLFDALIAGGASVPSDVVWPFFRNRIPECLILLARSGADEEDLLSLHDSDLDDPEWLVVNGLLLRMHSGRFLANMIEGARPSHGFGLFDPGDGWELNDTVELDPRQPPPGAIRTAPSGFPPIGVYALFTVSSMISSSAGTGDVLVIPGRHPVYYRRTLVPGGGSVPWPGHHYAEPDRRPYCTDFLADASGMGPNVVWGLFEDFTLVPWTGPEALNGKTDNPLRTQETGIRKLVESARQAGFRNIPPLRIRIESKIEDRRRDSRVPVPAPPDHWFFID